MDKIDVVMLTKNSDHILERCLSSLYENVPVRKLFVIDGNSTDQTLAILHRFGMRRNNIEVINDSGTRAKAREIGIREVGTDWFMFVDSDVLLSKNWFAEAHKQINEHVGAIWGLNIDVIPNLKSKVFLRTLGRIATEAFNLRGGMHDTLIKTSLVKDIRIPEQLHAFEDMYIVNWIKKKNHKVLIGEQVYCLHYRPWQDWNFRETLSLANLDLKCGLGYARNFKYVLYYPFFILYWLVQLKNKNIKPVMP